MLVPAVPTLTTTSGRTVITVESVITLCPFFETVKLVRREVAYMSVRLSYNLEVTSMVEVNENEVLYTLQQ